MTRKNHSTGLKLFIFLLVAMMLFSAIGVMVIYLNVPTTTPTTATLPNEPTTITLPPTEPTTGNDMAPVSGEAIQELPLGEAPTDVEVLDEQGIPTEEIVEEITGEATPTPVQE